ncbi:MAG: ECF-type sigma factor [Planctomycetota bacterium]
MAETQLTALLGQASAGDREAMNAAYELVEGELRRLAAGMLARERAGHTLQPTALVSEAAIKLLDQRADWSNRDQFFAFAATAMRRILVDHARARRAAKRGGGEPAGSLPDEIAGRAEISPEDVLALDELLTRLEALDERKARVVELRYFAGLDENRVAEVLGVSRSTVSADWTFAKAWLALRLHEKDSGDAG